MIHIFLYYEGALEGKCGEETQACFDLRYGIHTLLRVLVNPLKLCVRSEHVS